MNRALNTSHEIFSAYVYFRQNGLPVEESAKRLKSHVDKLAPTDRQQLSSMVKNWEATEGSKYNVRRPVAQVPPTPSPLPDGPMRPASASQPILPPVRSAPNPNMPSKSILGEQLLCPKCGKPNDLGERYCFSCGELLENVRVTTRALDDDDPTLSNTYFGSQSKIQFILRGVMDPIESLVTQEIAIGRTEKTSAMQPDVDFTPFKAEELGVSRLHASIKREDQTVVISDLNSKNGTYINGQKLHPHEIRVLRDGDEVRLGRLKLTIAFKHQVRSLPKA